jgi:hypothetical protein
MPNFINHNAIPEPPGATQAPDGTGRRMSADDLDDALTPVRLRAVDRLLLLMNRVKLTELTMPEILGLVAVFEAADSRVSAAAAPVLAFVARDGGRQP